MNSKSLSIPEWCALAKQKIAVPVTTRLNGSSMEPLIRSRKDMVTIVPVNRELLVGDIVLFERNDGVYVVHRIYCITQDKKYIQTWGDNCQQPDLPVPMSAVLGIVVSCRRNKKNISLVTEKQRTWGISWMNGSIIRSLWFLYKKSRSFAGKVIRKIYPDFHKKAGSRKNL